MTEKYKMEPGDKVWVFDGREVKQICVEGITAGLDGKAYVIYDGIKGRIKAVEPDLCFPTREALCEHYRKIFE